VLERYPKDVKVVFKNYPLRNHKYAQQAAAAAHAAEKQGKFWEFHDLLYENYNKLNNAKVIEISKELGLDVEKLLRDMKNPQILALISRDKREGDRAGVRGTPTIFINGRQFKDRRSLQGFGAVIDRELINAAKK
jgi:protein-disulfide isomerase